MKILVCPLDWGIGHATRVVPVIRKFMEAGDEIIVAADGRPFEFLKKEFPGGRFIRLKGAKITYPVKGGFLLNIIRLSPQLIISYFREHEALKRIVLAEDPGIIISDNRYGLWHRKKFCILITHQVNIVLPRAVAFLSGILNRLILGRIEKFNECWIPDFEFHNGLAGKLSHPVKLPVHAFYLGTLSRFSAAAKHFDIQFERNLDIMVILSGPEPQRTILEEKLFYQLRDSGLSGIIVRGFTEITEVWNLTTRIKVFSHLETTAMKEAILRSSLVICRSGYSSIMDLVTLGRKAILIPTPGQTEQEYLARYLMEKKIYFSMPQHHFDILYAIEMTRNFPGLEMQNNYRLLDSRIAAFHTRMIPATISGILSS